MRYENCFLNKPYMPTDRILYIRRVIRTQDGSCEIYVRSSSHPREYIDHIRFFPDYPSSDITVYITPEGWAYIIDPKNELSPDELEYQRRCAAFYYKTCTFLSYKDYKRILKEDPVYYDTFFNDPFSILDLSRDEFGEDKYVSFPVLDSCINIPSFKIRISELERAIRYILEKNESRGNSFMEFSELKKALINLLKTTGHPLKNRNIFSVLLYYPELFYCSEKMDNDSIIALQSTKRMEKYIVKTVSDCMKLDPIYTDYSPQNTMGLDDSQFTAVKGSILEKGRISIITGGPGTGKTTIIAQIAKQMLSTFPGLSVKFLSPTGMASKRMKTQMENAGLSDLQVSTIHKYLGIGAYKKPGRDDSGLIIIDEVSMISLDVFYMLLKGVDLKNMKIILVGDANQLPSIGTGNLLQDLEKIGIPVFRLSKNHRNEGLISKNAEKIMDGNPVFEFGNTFMLQRGRMSGFLKVLSSSESGDDKYISPFRKGSIPGSSEMINSFVKAKKNKSLTENEPGIGDIVLITRTNYKSGYINGEIGELVSKTRFTADILIGKDLIKVPNEDYCLGYSVSIHKSQGSEYDTVHIILPEASPFITRRMLYTAITRSKHKVIIYSEPSILFKTALNRSDEKKMTFIGRFGRDF